MGRFAGFIRRYGKNRPYFYKAKAGGWEARIGEKGKGPAAAGPSGPWDRASLVKKKGRGKKKKVYRKTNGGRMALSVSPLDDVIIRNAYEQDNNGP